MTIRGLRALHSVAATVGVELMTVPYGVCALVGSDGDSSATAATFTELIFSFATESAQLATPSDYYPPVHDGSDPYCTCRSFALFQFVTRKGDGIRLED